MEQADVIVVGAGPAGSSSAHFLANLGLEVLLIDKEGFPREKPCGDGIGPRAVYHLKKMGLEAWIKRESFYRVERVRLISSQGEVVASKIPEDVFPVNYGYIVPRKDLDHQLVKQAIRAGTRFVPDFKAQSFLFKNGRVKGVEGFKRVEGAEEGKKVKIGAKLVVLAEGSGGALVKNLSFKRYPSQALASRAYFQGVQGIDDCINIYFDKSLPQGYGWIFPLSRTLANVGVGVLLSSPKKIQLKEVFWSFLKNRSHDPLILSQAKMDSPLKGGVIKMNFGRSLLVRPGLAVVGDTAGLVSPINGEGISHAIESSEILGKCLEKKFKSEPLIDEALQEYRREMNDRYRSYFRWGKILNRLFGHPFVLNKVIKKAQKDAYLAQNLAGLFSNTVSPQTLLRLRHLKFLL